MTTENNEHSVPQEQIDLPNVDTTSRTTQTTQAEAAPTPDTCAAAAPATSATTVPEAACDVPVATDATETAADSSTESVGHQVDFSDEEAALAANAPEYDLGDEESSDEESKAEQTAQYAGQTKEQLLEAFAALLRDKPVQTIRKDVEAIKIAFYKSYRNEVDQLRRTFIEGGGNAEEFTVPVNEAEQQFKTLFAEYRQKRNDFIAQLDTEKEQNLKIKLQIIEELKELINSNETLNHTFNAFRELQHRWKETGLVPQTSVKDLWETYNLHVENFYNFIKINKELRDLDLKKNYEAKLQLCEDAEALVLEPAVIPAFHKLQKLHEQWRETGPVAPEFKEQLWERFREASSKINKRHQEYFDTLKDEQQKNLDLKSELCVKIEELIATPPATRKEWNKASDQLIEIQKVWKTIGFAPKKDNTRIYERFRTACDKFFEQKRNFYLQSKAEMEQNLQLKNEICAAAEALQQSDDWKKTTDELIALQKHWKEIGPVARRYSDAVWKRFRTACDTFFERKSTHFSSIDQQYADNLSKKQALIEEVQQFVDDPEQKSFDALKALQRRWSEIGFVPIKQKEVIQTAYRKVVDAAFAKLRGNEKERHMERFKGKIQTMNGDGGDRRIRHERERLFTKMKQLESDIALLENNIGFFSRSKNAEAMIRDVNDKIEKAKQEMATIIEKINVIDKQGE